MNKKNKNKNRSAKPSNPIPPPPVITSENNPEKVNLPVPVEKVESAVISEDRVPKIVSEVVPESAAESKEAESDNDSPKKPKRNRGKKKKHEQIVEEEKPKCDDMSVEIMKDSVSEEKTSEDGAPLAPASRKKKGKNKTNENNPEKEQPIKTEEKKIEPVIPAPVQSDPSEESKTKKKNRKGKKNRTDSERSEKADEITACTADSQKVVETKNEATKSVIGKSDQETKDASQKKVDGETVVIQEEVKNKSKEENIKPSPEIETQPKDKEEKKPKDGKSEMLQEKVAKQIKSEVSEKMPSDDKKQDDTPITESKSKRNKKKDKKHPPIDPLCDSKIEEPVQKVETISSTAKEGELTIPLEKVSDETKITVEDQKSENQEVTEIVAAKEEAIQETTSSKPKAKIAKPVEKKQKNKHDLVIDSQIKAKSDSASVETVTIPLIPEQKDIQQIGMPEEILNPISETKDIIEAPVEFNTPAKTETKEHHQLEPEAKNKKHKKSPKPQRKNFDTKVDANPTTSECLKIDVSNPVVHEEDDITREVVLPTAVGDVTPDQIEHPRSASEQFMDDINNNMVIQEVSTQSLQVTVTIPDTPLIVGSGETPIISPDNIMSTSFTVTEIGTILEEPAEKTDLKSKVLEVNRDMEELRLSIERSLAELTALEKSEEQGTVEIIPLVSKPQSVETKKEIKECSENVAIVETSCETKDSIVLHPDIPIQTESEIKPIITESSDIPVPPQRKENKGKNKSKKKGKQETTQSQAASSGTTTSTSQEVQSTEKSTTQEDKTNKTDSKETSKPQGKQQSDTSDKQLDAEDASIDSQNKANFEPIEDFEDAMTSSSDDVNKTFEQLAKETDPNENFNPVQESEKVEPDEDKQAEQAKQEKETPVSPSKNLLGHPQIPVPSSKTDYKKERNKTPNTILAKVKIKDSEDIEKLKRESKESQTEGKPKILKAKNESVTCVTNDNEEYVYKYSFRKVFLANACHVCKKDLKTRVTCNFCSLIFYCSQKHKEEDWCHHQPLCFAVTTIIHLKGQKHIYADANGMSGENYRLLRMQTILSCEKILKRPLQAWEQECLLYPRVCADAGCREWRQGDLADCKGCGQISYCASSPDHLPKTHSRWCPSYSLYHKLVVYQLTRGRLEPVLPTKVLNGDCRITDNINRLLADMYDTKIDMSDIQYASLTQLATAPLTAGFAYQLYKSKMDAVYKNGANKSTTFTIHIVNAELQFEADSLYKWETFFLHVKPEVEVLNVVLIGADLNPSNLPLELLGKIKLCPSCRVDKRRLHFHFHDRQHYHQYFESTDYVKPDIVCAFNPSISRSSSYTKSDPWSATIDCIFKSRVPFLVTSYTMNEMHRDMTAVKNLSHVEFKMASEPKFNPFASVRPDRNFITDDEMPLLFKNYCYVVLNGV